MIDDINLSCSWKLTPNFRERFLMEICWGQLCVRNDFTLCKRHLTSSFTLPLGKWTELRKYHPAIPLFPSARSLIESCSNHLLSEYNRSLICYTTWATWNSRNECLFQSKQNNAITTCHLAHGLADEYFSTMKTSFDTNYLQNWKTGSLVISVSRGL